MSVSAISSTQPSGFPDSIVPRLPSENAATASSEPSRLHMFAEEDDEPSFWDLLDVINPLQHIPIINSVYRELTGDKIGVGARLVGGTLFGGPIGLIGAALNTVLEEATGHDAGGHLIALFKDDAPGPAATAVAGADQPQPAIAAAGQATTPEKSASGQSADAGAARPMLLPDMGGFDAVEPKAPAAAPQAIAQAATIAQAAATPRAEAADMIQTLPPPPAAAPVSPVAAAEGKPMALLNGREDRLLALPSRTTAMATRSPPALGIATSNNSTRSNTPITGARPNRTPVSPAMVQQMAAGQAATGAPSGLSAIAGQPAAAPSGDWFSGAMMQGLSKYERNSRLGKAAPAGSVTEMQ